MAVPVNNTSTSSTSASLNAASLELASVREARIVLTGTYTGVEGTIDVSMDNSTWVNHLAKQETPAAAVYGTLTPGASNLSYVLNVAGWKFVRFNPTQVSSGTLVVTVYADVDLGYESVTMSLPVATTFVGGASFPDSALITLGTGADVTLGWDGTDLDVLAAADDSVLKIGNGTNSFDLWLYGNAASTYVSWDASADSMKLEDSVYLGFGTNTAGPGTKGDINITWNGTKLLVAQTTADSMIDWGVSGAGINHTFFGDTATYDMTWDQSNDQLLFNDNAKIAIGTGSDIVLSWDATRLNVTQATTNSEIRWGVDGAGIDQRWYGDTASASLLWDQSADALIFNGVGHAVYQTIAAATGTAIPVTHSGSFPITQNGAETNTLADPTFIGQWLEIFVDTDTSGARVITAASRINQAGNNTITMTEVGDYIRLTAITIAGALKWQVESNDGAALSTV